MSWDLGEYIHIKTVGKEFKIDMFRYYFQVYFKGAI